MFPYILMMIPPAVAALGESSKYSKEHQSSLGLKMFFLLMIVFVGFRYEVGADWGSYLIIYEWVSWQDLNDALKRTEPSYALLNYISSKFGGGIVLVNLSCAIIACPALYVFCKSQPRPWLATFIVTSSFVFVILMGLSRQGVALSLVFLALDRLAKNRVGQYTVLVILAATFHASALVMLPLIFTGRQFGLLLKIIFFTVFVSTIGFYVIIFESEYLQRNYISRELSATGSYFRFMFHIFASVIFLLLQSRMKLEPTERKVYRYFSIAALILFAVLFVGPSTTLIDRLAFYIIPLQAVVLSSLPNIISPRNKFHALGLVFVLSLYFSSVIVYFSFGNNADDYLPYSMGWFG